MAKGRTTVAVAHRLSTIQHADVIYVLGEGKVLEVGNHADLLKQKGVYYTMVRVSSYPFHGAMLLTGLCVSVSKSSPRPVRRVNIKTWAAPCVLQYKIRVGGRR